MWFENITHKSKKMLTLLHAVRFCAEQKEFCSPMKTQSIVKVLALGSASRRTASKTTLGRGLIKIRNDPSKQGVQNVTHGTVVKPIGRIQARRVVKVVRVQFQSQQHGDNGHDDEARHTQNEPAEGPRLAEPAYL